MNPRLRDLAALGTAVVACAGVLIAPAMARPDTPAASPDTLAAAWPYAHAFDAPGTVLSSDSYQPLVIITDGISIGTANSPDGTTISLVEVTSTHTPATVRVLQAGLDPSNVSYDAFAVTPTDVYVMRNTADTTGQGHESLWRISRAGGDPSLMTPDAGEALFQGSANDLQVAGGVLRWVASVPGDPSMTQLRTIALTGGPVHVRALPGAYALSTYPMLFSGGTTDRPHPELTDSLSGNVTLARTPQESGTVCDPVWCVMQAPDAPGGATTVWLCHPDGTGVQRIGGGNTGLVSADPTLLDRFVALTAQAPAASYAPHPTIQLWLYDLRTRLSVEVAGGASATFAVGDWLWWSTGDNETLAWHVLDLTTLR